MFMKNTLLNLKKAILFVLCPDCSVTYGSLVERMGVCVCVCVCVCLRTHTRTRAHMHLHQCRDGSWSAGLYYTVLY